MAVMADFGSENAHLFYFGREGCCDWVPMEHKCEVALAAKGIGWWWLDGDEFHQQTQHVGVIGSLCTRGVF